MENNNTNFEELKKMPTELLDEIEISENDFFEATTGTDVNEENNIKNSFDDIDNPNDPTQEQGGNMAELLDENFLVGIYDVVLVAVTSFGLDFLNVEYAKKDLELTTKEKAVLKPLVKKVAEEYMPNLNNPLEALLLASVMIIAGRVVSNFGNRKKQGPATTGKTIETPRKDTKGKKTPSKYMLKKYGPQGANK